MLDSCSQWQVGHFQRLVHPIVSCMCIQDEAALCSALLAAPTACSRITEHDRSLARPGASWNYC